jgi:hypothetical protein
VSAALPLARYRGPQSRVATLVATLAGAPEANRLSVIRAIHAVFDAARTEFSCMCKKKFWHHFHALATLDDAMSAPENARG